MKISTSNAIKKLWNNFLDKLKAENIEYNGANVGLDATNVQEAIDVLKQYVDTKVNDIVENRLDNCSLKYENGKYYISYNGDTEEV